MELLKKTLIFDHSVGGHHLEYIHHLYMGAVAKPKQFFIFAIPEAFLNEKHQFDWPESSNIIFIFLDDKSLKNINKSKLIGSFYISLIVKKLSIKYQITDVFFVTLMSCLPFFPFMINRKVRISGIIYAIYLYRWKTSTFWVRIQDVLKYLIISHSSIFRNVFLLNDEFSPSYLNKLYKTTKFSYLPDPYLPISENSIIDMREELNISKDKLVVLHFGSLTLRKGTLEILNAISLMGDEDKKRFSFVFAGNINHDIKNEFYKMYNNLKSNTQIIVFDQFCSFEFIGSLCKICNLILIPYKNTIQSSGVLGYAAQFGKPVAATKSGLLGKIVKRYDLGYLLEPDPFLIADFLCKKDEFKSISSDYLSHNSINDFLEVLNI